MSTARTGPAGDVGALCGGAKDPEVAETELSVLCDAGLSLPGGRPDQGGLEW